MIKNIQIALVAMLMAASMTSHAAFVSVDDTDIDDISIFWSGFDEFYLNDLMLTTDLGGTGSATFSDAVQLVFAGLFTVADIIDESFTFLAGSEVGASGDVTSDIGIGILAAGPPGVAYFEGIVTPYTNTIYGAGSTSYIQGDTITIFGSELEVEFRTESGEVSGVPAPASLFLMGLGLLGLGLRRKANI